MVEPTSPVKWKSSTTEQVQMEGELFKVQYTLKDIHKLSINSIKISPDGSTFATCSSDCTIKVFRLSDGELVTELNGHTRGISDLEYSPINPDIIASCSDDLTIRLWSIKRSKCIKILKKHTYHITAIKFSSKGNVLISGSADETITIWDLSSGKSLRTLAAHSDPVSSISLTPDNSIIISSSYDGLMRLFDLETGQCLKTLIYNSASHGTATASTNEAVNFPVSNTEVSPNGKYILSSSLDGVIRLWDYMENKVIKTYYGEKDTPISTKFICGAKFITKTKEPKIVSGSELSGILVWDVQSKEIVFQFKAKSPVLQVDIFDQGGILVSCSTDGIVNVLNLNSVYKDEQNSVSSMSTSPQP
ncbi:uncharacterized protein PRCAT00002282001 [Priceomyces carsonii]|uniref:uncharacterized protein n=1 Tax=Priceomyces carsonii TaxID=28549 RepID=UPI002ED793D5|nr:unnamed protein product [Priceomyces carsonii]